MTNVTITKLKKNGFVILFAVLLVSIVLSISLSLFNITFKQLILSSTARESQYAFYASESARNCAKFWNEPGLVDNAATEFDNAFGYFNNVPDANGIPTYVFVFPNSDEIECHGMTINVEDDPDSSSSRIVRRFTEVFNLGDRSSCAVVTVEKDTDPFGSYVIRSRGYNLGDASNCPIESDRTIERTTVVPGDNP